MVTVPKLATRLSLVPFAFLLMIAVARADQVEMQNGDHYIGKVVSLSSDTLILRSDVLGTVRLPRGKVALITFGASDTAHPVEGKIALPGSVLPKPSVAATNTYTDLNAAVRQLGASTNLAQQVQAQLLAGAGPEATLKFNELMGGLSSGRISVNDLRAQAKSAADQLRELKRELGGDSNPEFDAYLSILDEFLREANASGGSATNTAALPPKAPAESP